MRVSLADGRADDYDLLVGADGIWSRIRKALVGETKVRGRASLPVWLDAALGRPAACRAAPMLPVELAPWLLHAVVLTCFPCRRASSTQANYSGYTCYTGISDFTPPDIEIVGYRCALVSTRLAHHAPHGWPLPCTSAGSTPGSAATRSPLPTLAPPSVCPLFFFPRVFLGNGQYFVSSDVGGGKMQWYGFHKEPPNGADVEGKRKERLLQLFGHWTDDVVDLIKATPEVGRGLGG